MIVIDFFHGKNLIDFDGTKAEKALDRIGISTSKSTIPDDPNPPFRPSGLRIGTPAMTTRGVKETDMRQIVGFMHESFTHAGDSDYLDSLKTRVVEFSLRFPVPSLQWNLNNMKKSVNIIAIDITQAREILQCYDIFLLDVLFGYETV